MIRAPSDAGFAAFAVDVGVAAARARTSIISMIDTLVAIDSPRPDVQPERYRHSR